MKKIITVLAVPATASLLGLWLWSQFVKAMDSLVYVSDFQTDEDWDDYDWDTIDDWLSSGRD